IGDSAFFRCLLSTVVISDGVTSIGDYAFYYCNGLKSIEIPNSVTSIGNYAFSDCSRLSRLDIPDTVTSIGDYAFYGCSGLAGMLVIPDNVTYIGESAFRSCTGLTSVIIGSGVTEIGNLAFYQCSGLTRVTWNASACIKAGVPSETYPNAYYLIFLDCTNLWEVVIGKNVTSIPDHVFFGCSNLHYVYYEGSPDEWAEISFGSSALLKPIRYYYSEEQPTGSGNYWHYDADGVTPVKWPAQN
ncbi:MAG: leucine-rich repeat domain-containing protein, partial [Clostridia bacterium]|nr:leucine-rich repeat domain-containing protein [Clostridia bacterium]